MINRQWALAEQQVKDAQVRFERMSVAEYLNIPWIGADGVVLCVLLFVPGIPQVQTIKFCFVFCGEGGNGIHSKQLAYGRNGFQSELKMMGMLLAEKGPEFIFVKLEIGRFPVGRLQTSPMRGYPITCVMDLCVFNGLSLIRFCSGNEKIQRSVGSHYRASVAQRLFHEILMSFNDDRMLHQIGEIADGREVANG